MTTPDFSRLYAQLDLRPDCSLEEFKRAYRKRVAELHPDRRGNVVPTDDDGQLGLPELTSLYGLAMQFRKQHGRLPGGPAMTTIRSRPASGHPGSTSLQAPRSRNDGFANVSRRSWLVLLVLMAIAAYLIFSAPTASALRP